MLGQVPPNTTTLLKTIQIFNTATGEVQAIIEGHSPDSSLIMRIPAFSVGEQEGVLWEGWVCLNAGDTLWAFSSAVGVHFWAAGALLPGEATALTIDQALTHG